MARHKEEPLSEGVVQWNRLLWETMRSPPLGKSKQKTFLRVVKEGSKRSRGCGQSLLGVPSIALSGHQGSLLLLSSCPH